jgi:hypothetical protein
MVKEALQKHQGDLAEVIESLRSAVAIPPTQSIGLAVQGPDLRRIPLAEATAERADDKGWTITLALENTTEWELFQEHLRRDALWRLLAQWKESVAEYINASLALGRRVTRTLRETTGLEVMEVDDIKRANSLYAAGIEALYSHTVDLALGLSRLELNEELKAEDPHLYYGQYRIPVLSATGRVDQLRTKVVTALSGLRKPVVTNEVVSAYDLVRETTQRASKAIEELSLTRLVPGQCRVCRRLGL